MARRAGGVGRGRRPDRTPEERRRLHHLHAGEPGRRARLDPQLVQCPASRRPRRRRGDGRACRQHGDERPLARRPRCAATEPRTHARDQPLRGCMGGGPGPRSGHADSAGPDPSLHQGRGRRPRRVLSGEGPIRSGHADQRAAGRPWVCPVDGRRAARPREPALHAEGQAAGRRLLDRASRRRGADVLRLAAAQPDRRVDARRRPERRACGR